MIWSYYVKYLNGKLYWKVATSNRIVEGKEVGNKHGQGYREMMIHNKRYLIHRVVYEMHYGQIPKGMFVDHINGIRDDNRIENLRLATNSQNLLNAKLSVKNVIGIKGIHRSSKNRWAVFRGKLRVFTDDFFIACCIRKSWESHNEYCNMNY